MIERRELLDYALKALGTVDSGIELGVAAGEHAWLISEILRPKKLYLLDSWGLDEDYAEHTGETVEDFYPALEKTKKLFQGTKGVEIIQGKTSEEHLKFENKTFDFIYIDANHQYEAVKGDLENWFPKLRDGGVIAGHDYVDDLKPSFGVIKALTEFQDTHKDKIVNFLIFGSGLNRSWLIETGGRL